MTEPSEEDFKNPTIWSFKRKGKLYWTFIHYPTSNHCDDFSRNTFEQMNEYKYLIENKHVTDETPKKDIEITSGEALIFETFDELEEEEYQHVLEEMGDPGDYPNGSAEQTKILTKIHERTDPIGGATNVSMMRLSKHYLDKLGFDVKDHMKWDSTENKYQEYRMS